MITHLPSLTALRSSAGKDTPQPPTKHDAQTPASLLVKISPLALYQGLSLPVLFQHVKHRFSPRLGTAFSRLPSIKSLTWQFISPMFFGETHLAYSLNFEPKDTLYQRLITSTDRERVSLLNEAINTENKDEFDKCFDWFNEKLLKQTVGDYALRLRDAGVKKPNEYGQEDCTQLLRHGLRLETLLHRYNLPPLHLPAPLARLLSQKVLAALIAACPLDDTHTTNISEALLKTSVLIARLSEALNDESASKGEALFHTLSALQDRPLQQWNSYRRASKKYPELKQFRKSYAKLYWINHYQKFASDNQANTQVKFTTNATPSQACSVYTQSE